MSRIAITFLVLALGFILGLTLASAISDPQASSSQGSWEYRVLEHYKGSGKNRLETDLNNLGYQGFEVCEMIDDGGASNYTGQRILVVVRRPR
jgi:hypothetical protein